jgi:hypothetical protein
MPFKPIKFRTRKQIVINHGLILNSDNNGKVVNFENEEGVKLRSTEEAQAWFFLQ